MEGRAVSEPLDSLAPVMNLEDVERIKEAARRVRISEPVKRYILDITDATRGRDGILIGASPRASLSLMRTARTRALIAGRDFATPDDVKTLAPATLAHRFILRGATRLNLDTNRAALAAILDEIPVPRPG